MAELMLAVARGEDLKGLKNMPREIIERTLGVKVLLNDTYRLPSDNPQSDKERLTRFAGVSALARTWGAKHVMVDAKFPLDTDQEMWMAVNSVMEVSPGKKRGSDWAKPTSLTVSAFSSRLAIQAFEQATRMAQVEPVCFMSSSRFDDEDYLRIGSISPSSFVLRQADMLEEHTTIREVLLAGADAQTIKEAYPEFKTFVTGVTLDGTSNDHVRPSRLEAVLPYSDVVIVGNPIFRSENPAQTAEQYLEIIDKV